MGTRRSSSANSFNRWPDFSPSSLLRTLRSYPIIRRHLSGRSGDGKTNMDELLYGHFYAQPGKRAIQLILNGLIGGMLRSDGEAALLDLDKINIVADFEPEFFAHFGRKGNAAVEGDHCGGHVEPLHTL